ncbi:NACHT domain-containing protein [Streptomyces sp. NPDC056500]|uniref:NACHT domain-containing protein n=1 Tax=Streptomyces sp. NPDC056500 TaxID=3345840 RepID=UPI0036737285
MHGTMTARVVAVHGRQQGTGVLLTPRTVLTCAHVSGSGRVEISHPALGQRVGGAALLLGDPKVIDAALLIADHDIVPSDRLGRLRWARLTRDDALSGCQTIGFPSHQRYQGERLDFGQYTGSVLPVAGRMHGVLTFWLDHSPGVPHRTSPLAGLSGAPVLAGSVLVGMVTRVRDTDGHQHLEAIPMEAIHQILRRSSLLGRFSALRPRPRTARPSPDALPVEQHWPGVLDLPPLERLSSFHPQDAAFEEGYASALKAQYRKTEVFGIDELGISESSWDLDTAYVSLEAVELEPHDSPDPGPPRPIDTPVPRSLRIEDLLGLSQHTLLRGEAGAGKTTLVWWLAAHASCGTLPGALDELNGLVPFVIPMRSLHADGGPFPGPDELPGVAGLPIGRAPEGWATRVLESGRALILVDGLDELPQTHRHKARSWLTLLLGRYNGSRALATVRPGAVEARWLASEGFADLLLLPMSDQDIKAFVRAWHRAAALEYAALDRRRADAEAHALSELEQRLTREFDTNRVLRDLARTPLLCAVICALHRKRKGALPHTRWELYQATLDMLLGKRDSGRGIHAPEGLVLNVEENKLLLQHIAVWLVRNGQTQLTFDEAVTQIGLATRSMRQVRDQGTPEQILTHLINRSGLLQQRTGSVVQFIHRTFQDYLAAKEFSDTDSLGELLRHAPDEQWRDVIRLAVGHLDRNRVSALVKGLIARGDQAASGSVRRALHILAAHCAAAAVFLDDTVLTAAEDRIRALMPPTTSGQVHELTGLGAFVLPLLPGASENPHADRMVIETIAAIGEEAGLERLVDFAQHPAPPVRRALANVWASFPAQLYARRVLARTRLDDVVLNVWSDDELAALEHCSPTVGVVALFGSHSGRTLDARLPRTGLRSLRLNGNHEITELGFLRNRPALSTLTLIDCPKLTSLAELADRSLRRLEIGQGELALSGPHPQVTDLQVFGLEPMDHPDYTALSRWDTVATLSLMPPQRMSALIRATGGMTALQGLTVRAFAILDLEATDTTERITSLSITSLDRHLNTAALARVFPSLRQLTMVVRGVREYALDLTPLAELPDLTITLKSGGGVPLHITGAEPFGGRLRTMTAQ